MRVIILAAGKGSRLGNPDMPKPLAPLVNGRTVLSHQLYCLEEFVSLQQVVLIIGHRKEMLMEAFPDLLYVYNSQYAQENTSKSLSRALQKFDEDILWINGDVVFHSSVVGQILEEKRTSMIVNRGVVGEEEVKYRTDGAGKIIEVSKQVAQPEGEALGINLITKNDLPLFKNALEECRNEDYFEKGLELCIHKGMYVRAVQVDPNLCCEIDFPEDLVRANELITQWTQA